MKKVSYVFLVLISIIFFQSCSSKIPTDKQMIDNFNLHKKIFNELVNMTHFNSNFISIYADNNSRDKYWNVPQDILLKYKALLKSANLSKLWVTKKRKNIVLGYYYHDAFKEYIYTQTPPSPLENSLDKYSGKINISVYKHIEGNWYLHYYE